MGFAPWVSHIRFRLILRRRLTFQRLLIPPLQTPVFLKSPYKASDTVKMAAVCRIG